MSENSEVDLQSDDQQLQAAAFGVYSFKGKELKPFSEGRRAAAQALGVKILSGVEMPVDKLYDGALWDCHIIIWLCQADPLQIIRSHGNPDKVMEKIMEWADKNVTPSDYSEEIGLVGKILSDTYSTKVIPVNKDKLPDPPGNV